MFSPREATAKCLGTQSWYPHKTECLLTFKWNNCSKGIFTREHSKGEKPVASLFFYSILFWKPRGRRVQPVKWNWSLPSLWCLTGLLAVVMDKLKFGSEVECSLISTSSESSSTGCSSSRSSTWSLSRVWLFATLWTVAHQTPLSMDFSARILKWVAISFSRRSSWPRDQTWISCVSWVAGIFFTHCAIKEALVLVQFNRSVVSESLRPHEQ